MSRMSSKVAFPLIALLSFTVSGFLTIMTENMPSGLLPSIAKSLDVSESLAGQLLTLYALGSVVAAIPIVTATRSISRRPLLMSAILYLLVFNSLTALSGNYMITLAARFVAGMAAGVIWGLLAGYARRLVPVEQQGKAMAIVGVGQPIALSLGVPLGAWMGTFLQWQGVFWTMSAVALILLIWIRLAVPNIPGQPADRNLPLRRVLMLPGLRTTLLVIFLWILAHNILYTYIAPFTADVGLGEENTGVVLLVFGLSSVVGVWLVGTQIDRALRRMTLASLVGFAAAAVLLAFASQSEWLAFVGIALWGLSFGGAPTLLQTATADAGGEEADVAISMLVTVFNVAVAGGGLLGGVLLPVTGVEVFPWILFGLALFALLVTWSSRQGFRPGRRGATATADPTISEADAVH